MQQFRNMVYAKTKENLNNKYELLKKDPIYQRHMLILLNMQQHIGKEDENGPYVTETAPAPEESIRIIMQRLE